MFVLGGLLNVPFTKHHEVMRSFPLRVKDWLAERIANNMIDAQLVETDSDVESDTEMSTSSQEWQLHRILSFHFQLSAKNISFYSFVFH